MQREFVSVDYVNHNLYKINFFENMTNMIFEKSIL